MPLRENVAIRDEQRCGVAGNTMRIGRQLYESHCQRRLRRATRKPEGAGVLDASVQRFADRGRARQRVSGSKVEEVHQKLGWNIHERKDGPRLAAVTGDAGRLGQLLKCGTGMIAHPSDRTQQELGARTVTPLVSKIEKKRGKKSKKKREKIKKKGGGESEKNGP